MAIQSVEHWEKKARLAAEKAEATRDPATTVETLEMVELYRQLSYLRVAEGSRRAWPAVAPSP
jgi:hypothetical protein